MLGLANVNGTLCVTCLIAHQDDPLFNKVYWPTTIDVGTICNVWRDKINRDNLDTIKVVRGRMGEYAIYPDYEERNGHQHWGIGTTIQLVDYGRTQPVKTDLVENPRPKTKRQCRYRNGRWQILFKSTGWKDA